MKFIFCLGLEYPTLIMAMKFVESEALHFRGNVRIFAIHKESLSHVARPAAGDNHQRSGRTNANEHFQKSFVAQTILNIPLSILEVDLQNDEQEAVGAFIRARKQTGHNDERIKYNSATDEFNNVFWKAAETICYRAGGDYSSPACSAAIVREPPCKIGSGRIHFIFDMSFTISFGSAEH